MGNPSLSLERIVASIDGLDAGALQIFMCTTDEMNFGARVEHAEIRAEHTVNSLVGYDVSVEGAIRDLWARMIEVQDDCILVRNGDGDRRGYRWNGWVWKTAPLPPSPPSPEQEA